VSNCWRYIPGYEPGDVADVFFRFDFIVEADVTSAAESYASAFGVRRETAHLAFRRRADMLFLPLFHRLWLDAGLRRLADPETVGLLEMPYTRRADSGPFDANLNLERWQIVRRLRLTLLEHWPDLIRQARVEAEIELRRSVGLSARSADAIGHARQLDVTRFAQLRARAHTTDEKQASDERHLLAVERAAPPAPSLSGPQPPRVCPSVPSPPSGDKGGDARRSPTLFPHPW
jgi:ATP-dependent helicase HepA